MRPKTPRSRDEVEPHDFYSGGETYYCLATALRYDAVGGRLRQEVHHGPYADSACGPSGHSQRCRSTVIVGIALVSNFPVHAATWSWMPIGMPHTNTIIGMKLTLQLQRLPDSAQADALRTTVERFNEAATWLADVAFRERCANKIALQKLTYY